MKVKRNFVRLSLSKVNVAENHCADKKAAPKRAAFFYGFD
jgi:hypothetical protein